MHKKECLLSKIATPNHALILTSFTILDNLIIALLNFNVKHFFEKNLRFMQVYFKSLIVLDFPSI